MKVTNKMKVKKYTKQQILESIKHWTKKLNEASEFDDDNTGNVRKFKSNDDWKRQIPEILSSFKNGTVGPYRNLWNEIKNKSEDSKIDAIDNVAYEIMYDIAWGIEWYDPNYHDNDNVDSDISETYNYLIQVDSIDFVSDAINGNKNGILKAFIDQPNRMSYGKGERFNPNWKQNLPLCRKFFIELFDIIHDKANNIKTFTIDYTAWHQDKYQIEIEAKDEAEARKKFLAENPEQYDLKDIEIEDIYES